MTKALTTERLREIASSPSFDANPLSHEVKYMARELLASREAQPVYQCRFFTTDVDGKQIGEWQDMDKGFYDQYDPYCRRILYTAPPAPDEKAITPAVPELITEDEQEEAVSDGYADSFRGGWNACRAAMLAQPVSQECKLPDNVREALTLALQAMEFMGDTLNNIDAVCTEDVEYVTPAFTAVRGLLAAAPEGYAPATKINCWSCKKNMTTLQLMSSDGICPHCNVEIDTEDDDE